MYLSMNPLYRSSKLYLTSKYKKDVANEIKEKIQSIWKVDMLWVYNYHSTEFKISYRKNIDEKDMRGDINYTLFLNIDIKDKSKKYNLEKDFNISWYFKDFELNDIKGGKDDE